MLALDKRSHWLNNTPKVHFHKGMIMIWVSWQVISLLVTTGLAHFNVTRWKWMAGLGVTNNELALAFGHVTSINAWYNFFPVRYDAIVFRLLGLFSLMCVWSCLACMLTQCCCARTRRQSAVWACNEPQGHVACAASLFYVTQRRWCPKCRQK